MSCSLVWAPKLLSYFTSCSSLLMGLMATAGNLLIVIAVIVDPYHKLRSSFNYFVVNLAICDLLIGVITLPISTYIHLKEAEGIIAGQTSKVVHISYIASYIVSTFSLAALTLDRYLAITRPISYRMRTNWKAFVCASLVIWVVAGLITSIYFMINQINFLVVMSSSVILLTIGILIFTYRSVHKSLKRRQTRFALNNVKEFSSSSSLANSLSDSKKDSIGNSQQVKSETNLSFVRKRSPVSSSSYHSFQESTNRLSTSTNADLKSPSLSSRASHNTAQDEKQLCIITIKNQRVVRYFFLVTFCFLICAAPATIMIFILKFCRTCDCITIHVLRDLMLLLCLLSSCINPYVLIWRLKDYRGAIKTVITCCFRRGNKVRVTQRHK